MLPPLAEGDKYYDVQKAGGIGKKGGGKAMKLHAAETGIMVYNMVYNMDGSHLFNAPGELRERYNVPAIFVECGAAVDETQDRHVH